MIVPTIKLLRSSDSMRFPNFACVTMPKMGDAGASSRVNELKYVIRATSVPSGQLMTQTRDSIHPFVVHIATQ